MGMFDSLTFDCIFCGQRLEEQTKAGLCSLNEFKYENNLPTWLMLDLNGTETECYRCKRKQKLIFDLEINLKRKEIIPTNNLDLVEYLAKKKALTNLNKRGIIKKRKARRSSRDKS